MTTYSLSGCDGLVFQQADTVGENGEQMSMQLMPERRKVPPSEHYGSPALPLRQAMKLEAIGRHSSPH